MDERRNPSGLPDLFGLSRNVNDEDRDKNREVLWL